MKDDNKNSSDCQTVFFSVYVLWCQCTNQFYVGVTGQERVYTRIYQHMYGKLFVDKEIRRFGWEGNWDWWVVEEGVSSELITEREQYWVEFFHALYPSGYNKTIGGIKHFKHSEETREQIGTSQLGRKGYWAGKKRPDMSGENHPLYGRHHTQETCKKMSKSHLGKKRAPFTEEHKANISKARTGKKTGKPAWNRGVPCAEEAKDKIRKRLTGRKRPDQSERMKGENNPNFGKHLSEGTKDKMREAKRGKTPWNKGVPHSEEAKAKIREKALARHAAKRAAKAVAEENLAAANSSPTSLTTLLDAVILQ